MNYLLLHGAWHDGSAWDGVAACLRARGHTVHAPTLAGHGPAPDARISHEGVTQALVDYVRQLDLTGVTAVAHSLGGTFLARLAEREPERFARLVFVSAFIPRSGVSMLDDCPPLHRANLERLGASRGDGLLRLPYGLWRRDFIEPLDERAARAIHACLAPQPLGPCQERYTLERFPDLAVPMHVVHCEDDRALPPGHWGWHPRMTQRLRMPRVVSIPGSHEILYTAPERLAAILLALPEGAPRQSAS